MKAKAVIGLQYKARLEEYLYSKGIPTLLVTEQISWVSYPVVVLKVKILQIQVGVNITKVPLYSICQHLEFPLIYMPKETSKLVLPLHMESFVHQYCTEHQLDYASVLSHIEFQEYAELPNIVDKTHLSVRSTALNKKYDVLYVPKLLKYVSNPTYNVWMYISVMYEEVLKQILTRQELYYETLLEHIIWVPEVDTFDYVQATRSVKNFKGEYERIDLGTLKAECVLYLEHTLNN